MNYQEIKKVLENNDIKEVFKGIVSFEKELDDNNQLEKIYDEFINNDYANLLSDKLNDIVESVEE